MIYHNIPIKFLYSERRNRYHFELYLRNRMLQEEIVTPKSQKTQTTQTTQTLRRELKSRHLTMICFSTISNGL